MDRKPAPCLACGTMVPATCTTCDACGYGVEIHDRWRFLLGSLGTMLSLSVVLAPIGLPMLWRAHLHRLAAEGSVTRRRRPAVRDHLAAVLRQHLSWSG